MSRKKALFLIAIIHTICCNAMKESIDDAFMNHLEYPLGHTHEESHKNLVAKLIPLINMNLSENLGEKKLQQKKLDLGLIAAAGPALNDPKERFDIIKKLLDKGANPQFVYQRHGTALLRATLMNHVTPNEDSIQLLIDRRSDVNQHSRDYETALHIACCYGELEVTKILIQARASLTLEDYISKTPLRRAEHSQRRDPEVKKQELIDYLKGLEKIKPTKTVTQQDQVEQKSTSAKKQQRKKHGKRRKKKNERY